MLRALFSSGRYLNFPAQIRSFRWSELAKQTITPHVTHLVQSQNFSTLQQKNVQLKTNFQGNNLSTYLLLNPKVLCIYNNIASRSVTKFSLKKGKRKTVRAVVKRFYRLHWGGWIRTRAGRHKHLWKKSYALRKRLKEHVFVNGTQATLLDKMVTKYWKRPKFYVDDPYEPYHTREEFHVTRRKPT